MTFDIRKAASCVWSNQTLLQDTFYCQCSMIAIRRRQRCTRFKVRPKCFVFISLLISLFSCFLKWKCSMMLRGTVLVTAICSCRNKICLSRELCANMKVKQSIVYHYNCLLVIGWTLIIIQLVSIYDTKRSTERKWKLSTKLFSFC